MYIINCERNANNSSISICEVCIIKAILRLLPNEEAMEFVADDFYLWFGVGRVYKKIDKVLEVEGVFASLIISGEEEHLDISEVSQKLDLDWDFSKYKMEVMT